MAVVGFFSACAPTSVAPSIIRLAPTHHDDAEFQFGVRTGPRISAVTQAQSTSGFDAQKDGSALPALGFAYELDYTRIVWRRLALHAGVQTECMGGLPMIGLGVSAGVSYRWELGRVSFAPALAARGSTDFGLVTNGGPASFVSGDASFTISAAGIDESRLGLAPFISVQRTFQAQDTTTIFFGGLLVVRYRTVEIFGGLGRSSVSGGPAWNVPLVGLRFSGS